MAELRIPDVSEFQGVIGWPALVAYLRATWAGAAAILRLCYGDLHVDLQADANIDGARAAGTDAVGLYLYLVAGRDPVAQADTFARVLRAHGGLRRGEFVVVDDEESTGGDESARVNAALDRLDQQLQEPNPSGEDWWYSGLNFAIAHNLPVARGHRFIAAYQATEPTAIAHDLWQATDAATMPGIAGPVDSSVFHGSIADLVALVGGAPLAPPVTCTGGISDMGLVGFSYRPGGLGTVQQPAGYRLDRAVIGDDGALWHSWSNTGASADGWSSESLGAPAAGFDPAYGAGCTWDDRGAAITFSAVGRDRQVYRRIIWGLAGTLNQQTPPTGWDALAGAPPPAALPVASGAAPVPPHHHVATTGPAVVDSTA